MAALGLLISAGCAGRPGGDATAPAAAPSTTAVVPYVDVSLGPTPLVEMARATGVTDVVLAFALATDGACTPSWGGTRSLTDPGLLAEIDALRGRGGRVAVATGGADGPYLETTCATSGEPAAAYGALLDATGSTHLDVDVEASIPTGTVVQSLRRLQDARGTDITLTLRVTGPQAGLEAPALDLVRAADAAGLRFGVNAMVMNFPFRDSWARAMTDAVDATSGQLRALRPAPGPSGVAPSLGITLMIGRTDTGPVTTLADARAVAAAASARGLRDVRFWSLARDNGNCPGAAAATFDCSGVEQAPFAFTETVRDAVRAPAAHQHTQDGS
ncbi:carbohydrate-binding protein CenC [Pseudonocardia sp. 73-21]|uniref:carbohydrate-binding protein CenC n=1 Tax=Pseudonocardia sp. 73-21 TaxID=1895809 RepID=UPI000966AC63|nr:carbohydrate-binding protein CenC [Pseudonocardia sp. 73-21]OJY39696.1 MAG: hypothetical protein BGP03_03345 [Pseudonocardia sp. 73-21]